MAVMPTDHQARSQDFIYISLAALENFEAKDGLGVGSDGQQGPRTAHHLSCFRSAHVARTRAVQQLRRQRFSLGGRW